MNEAVQSRKVNLPEKIADQIRDLIARGVLTPGVQLRQMELADKFGSSRVPLREALKRLTVEGIVEHDQNRGFFVSRLSSDDAAQLYRIRHLLEAEALKTIEWPDEKKLAELSNIVDKLDVLLEAKDSSGWLSSHRKFLESLFDLCPHKVLVGEIMRYINLTERYRSWAPHVLNTSHRRAHYERQLLEQFANRDRKRLLKVFKEQRDKLEKSILDDLRARGL